MGIYAIRNIQNNKRQNEHDWRFTAVWMLIQMGYERVDSLGNEIYSGDPWEEQVLDQSDEEEEEEVWSRKLRSRFVHYPAVHTRA